MDWDSLGEEAIDKLREYIRLDTSNPPGNEIIAANYFKGILEKEGIECEVAESEAGRGHLIARLKGDESEAPLIILNHTDVVPVERDKWEVDPFGGVIKDSYIWGRGTLDMKGMGILELMVILILKRNGLPLRRDVIFLATGDEETGGMKGAKWMLERYPTLKEAALVLNEGGTGVITEDGELEHYEVNTGEKIIYQIELTATGRPGHGSIPNSDNANVKLVRALKRVAEWTPPFEVIPTVREYFIRLADKQDSELADLFRNIDRTITDPEALTKITANSIYEGMLRNTINITILNAGSKTNVIPSTSIAELDVRLLPGASKEEFHQQLVEVIADGDIKVEAIKQSATTDASPLDSELYLAIEEVLREADPGAIVTPAISTGASDSRFFRALGIPSYGFIPFKLTWEELKLAHGHNERISIENIKFATKIIYEIVAKVCVK